MADVTDALNRLFQILRAPTGGDLVKAARPEIVKAGKDGPGGVQRHFEIVAADLADRAEKIASKVSRAMAD